jgi:hypothetical protein
VCRAGGASPQGWATRVGRSPRRVGQLGLPRLGLGRPLSCPVVRGVLSALVRFLLGFDLLTLLVLLLLVCVTLGDQWVALVVGLLAVVILGSCLQARMGR